MSLLIKGNDGIGTPSTIVKEDGLGFLAVTDLHERSSGTGGHD
jgi:hypothetical protein